MVISLTFRLPPTLLMSSLATIFILVVKVPLLCIGLICLFSNSLFVFLQLFVNAMLSRTLKSIRVIWEYNFPRIIIADFLESLL